jgi:hypothetical protein
MVRPNAIVWFERLYLGSWLLSLIGLAYNWGSMHEMIEQNPVSQQFGVGTLMNMVIAGIALGALVTLVLWYFTARQHSVVAKWFVVGFFVLGLFGVPALIRLFTTGELTTAFLQAGVFVLHAASVWMLFQRDARVWFGEVRDAPPPPPAPLV